MKMIMKTINIKTESYPPLKEPILSPSKNEFYKALPVVAGVGYNNLAK
jgi:hypothetical protein